MERLTTNKPVDEMSMLELAYNSCYAENGKAMYRDFETVKDARDFVREANVYLLDSVLPADDDEFDERIIDDLQYDPTIYVRGLIALFYRNLWAMADMRETLKAYEDKQEQGLLFSVLCKIGDTIYKIPSDVNFKLNVLSDMHNLNRVYEQKVNRIEVCDDEGRILYITCEGMDCVLSTFYKETWFLTREEAEEALAKMKEDIGNER